MSPVALEEHAVEEGPNAASRASLRPTSAMRRRQAKLAYFQTLTEPTVVGIEEVRVSGSGSILS